MYVVLGFLIAFWGLQGLVKMEYRFFLRYQILEAKEVLPVKKFALFFGAAYQLDEEILVYNFSYIKTVL